MTLYSVMVVASGGAIGAVLRFGLSSVVAPVYVFPWATLGINIAGSFAIGLVWGGWGDSEWFESWGRFFLVVGLLGGFTTFSAFSLETITLIQEQRAMLALLYASASVLGCVFMSFVGMRVGQLYLA